LRTYALDEARAEFSSVVDRALAGEPQRIARDGNQAVVVVSESDWFARRQRAQTLGELLANFIESSAKDAEPPALPIKQTRPLGADFLRDEDLETNS